eukprot:TRINITY_DN18163_c0_g2_i1.p1 TRINITY_DN18163_c0_g2~~TRINITY_DN18163_c0_g2_i1.p1  ORF type:complete len:519 (-),score=92.22 TRINITY_DN18163_c0_g2_i1:300-1856(-)
MFAVSARFLDGSSRRIEVGANATIAELRAIIAQGQRIPEMHEIKLLQGDREVHDDSQIEVEMQVLTVPNVALAVDILCLGLANPGRIVGLGEQVRAALELLGDMQQLPPNFCEQMLESALNFTAHASWQPRVIREHFLRIGKWFGSVCDNPAPYLQRLCDVFDSRCTASTEFCLGALAKIAEQGKLSPHSSHAKATVQSAELLRRISTVSLTDPKLYWGEIECCIGLLGCLRSAEAISAIQAVRETAQNIWSVSSSEQAELITKAVDAAMERIRARPEPGQCASTHSAENEQNGAALAAQQSADASTTDDTTPQTKDDDLFVGALQNSKANIPSTGLPLNSDGVVVLRLTRMACSLKLREHLRTAETLAPCRQRVVEAGCAVEPESTNGPQFFVPLTHDQIVEAELELSSEHVVLLNSDVEQFREALREFNCKGKRRPALNPVHFGDMSRGKSHDLASADCPASSSSTQNTAYEEVPADDEGPVEVEPVGYFTVRADSSLGYPEAVYPRVGWTGIPRT